MDIYKISKEEWAKNSKIPFRVAEKDTDMHVEMARLMADVLKENNAKGEKTVIILPVGPIMQYAPFAKVINEEKISLKNAWFINMDEYLTAYGKWIDYDNNLSFRAVMDRLLYSKIDAELVMPESQRLFPEPGKEAEIDALIESFGKVDICLTGVGINGHIAFNEPPEADEAITDEEFKNIGTRCLNIARETIVNNGLHKVAGALDIFPRRCITLGMKQLLKARVLKVYLYCDWQWGIARKISLADESKSMPASFLQSHPNSEMIITKDLYEFML